MPLLQAPTSGVTVRMYRQGHGDCFLLAFPREGGGDPVYVLIDCGYKPGSPDFVHDVVIGDIVDHIGESTGNHLDLMVITHEHQDHLNGIWKEVEPYFDRFTIDNAWMAWTEDPHDELAEELRQRFHDQLLGLVAARQKLALAAAADDPALQRIDALLSLEIGGDGALSPAAALAAAKDPNRSVNKQGLKLIRDKANDQGKVDYLSPGDVRQVPKTGVRAYVFGPPRDLDLLRDEDPQGSEAFPDDTARQFTFAAAAGANGDTPADGATDASPQASPFGSRFRVKIDEALTGGNEFFTDHYGKDDQGQLDEDDVPALDNAPWRRIDTDWLYSAETLALALNKGINNTSLVLAFELPQTKKVLFFVGDAQRGNWISWNDVSWTNGDKTVTPRDLLARTVLYKVGHHGSHNATLDGTAADEYANLSWMGTEDKDNEFTAMITAVNAWAMKQTPPWVHPLPSIKKALVKKAQGRVFQTDTDELDRPESVSAGAWKAFLDRSNFDDRYFDYTVRDE